LSRRFFNTIQAYRTAVHTAVVVHIDATSWREAGQRRWLQAATTNQVTSFRITTGRGRAGLDTLLPATFDGIVGSDRWNAYTRYPAVQRQLCWAHLTRNLRALAEGGMRDSPWARDLLPPVESMFIAWHTFRDGATTRAGVQTAMQPIQSTIRTALEDGRPRPWDNITAFSQEVLTWRDALWTVVTHPGVAPTNNAAERMLRPSVIWRKQGFGTQSADGSRFVERILSVVTTCRQQGRNVWNLLTDAVRASMTGHPAPTLLPTP
jgi:transposase